MEKRRVKRDAKGMMESRVPLTSSLDDETVRNVTRHLVLDSFVSEELAPLLNYFDSFYLFFYLIISSPTQERIIISPPTLLSLLTGSDPHHFSIYSFR
jgi:hypothetical protein